jgi:RHS repeat-associated protein
LLFEGAATSPLSTPVSQMGARSYVPALGVFLQPDPVPNGATTAYNYAAGDPINASDVSGTSVLTGAWWKANGGQVLRVAIGVAVGTAVGVLTAGTGTSVGVAIAAGLASGAVGGVAGDYLGQVVANYASGGSGAQAWTDVNWAEIGVAGLVGAIAGGVGGGLRAYRNTTAIASQQASFKAYSNKVNGTKFLRTNSKGAAVADKWAAIDGFNKTYKPDGWHGNLTSKADWKVIKQELVSAGSRNVYPSLVPKSKPVLFDPLFGGLS